MRPAATCMRNMPARAPCLHALHACMCMRNMHALCLHALYACTGLHVSHALCLHRPACAPCLYHLHVCVHTITGWHRAAAPEGPSTAELLDVTSLGMWLHTPQPSAATGSSVISHQDSSVIHGHMVKWLGHASRRHSRSIR